MLEGANNIRNGEDVDERHQQLGEEEQQKKRSKKPTLSKQKRNKPTLSCEECVERKTKVSLIVEFVSLWGPNIC